MTPEEQQTKNRNLYLVLGLVIVLVVVSLLWIPLAIGRVLTGTAPWGPKIGGKLPNGSEVYFQARPGGFETDDRLTVLAPGIPAQHYWVDRVHAGFQHVVLKVNDTESQLWVESDGEVGASIDLVTGDFRAEGEQQHAWAKYGSGRTLDSGSTITLWSVLRPW